MRTTDDLRLTGRNLAAWQNTDIIGLVPWVMGLSLVLIGFAFLVLTGIREPLRDLLPGTVRSALMVGGCALVLGFALIAMLGKSKPTWHRNATIAAVGVGLVVGAIAAFADQVLSEMEDPIGFGLGAFVTLIAIWGIIEAHNGGYPATQRLLQRTLVTFLVVAGLIRWLIPIEPSESLSDMSRPGVAAFVAAVLMMILSATIVAIARSQQQYAIAVSADRLRQDRQRLIIATDAERKLESALHQWSWTGASINYVTQYPFGQVKAIEHAPVHLEPLGLLRFQVLELNLAPDGRQALLAGLLSSATTPGWLLSQYNRVAHQFAEREARLRNLPPGSSDDFIPETDPEPLRPNTPPAVRDVSPRVAFARWLNEARGDEILAAAVVDSDKVDIYKTLLSFDSNYRLTVVSGPDGLSYPSMSALFAGVVPETPHLLDPELVTTLFSASDSAQQMQTAVWWPEDLMEAHHDNLGHVTWKKSEPFVRAENAEYLVLQTIRFDRSESFPFHVLAGTKPPDPVTINMPEDVM